MQLSDDLFVDVTDARLPPVAKESNERVWAEWVDTDRDGFVDRRPSYSVAVGDVDGDGDVDLFLNNHFGDRIGPPPSLWLNEGNGTFVDGIDMMEPGPDGNIATGDRHGSVFADFDNDGDQDLLLLIGLATDTEPSRSKLFINEDGMLIDRGIELGIGYSEARSREAVVFDLNNDGLLDFLHAANADGTKVGELVPTIFQQNADGSFANVGSQAGYQFDPTYGVEYAVMADLDRDGRMEMIQKQLFTVFDVSTGVFVDITSSVFADVRVENQRGLTDIGVGDFNGDLVPDFFLPSSAVNAHQLVLSSPDGWVDVSETSGVRDVPYLTTDGGGVGVGDFDNDADLDMIVLDRTVEGSDYFLENDGTGVFTGVELSLTDRPFTLARPDLRSVAIADFNDDGALDLLETTTSSDPTYRILENQGAGNHFLTVVLEGTTSNRDGLGASVEVSAGGITQLRQQTGGVHHRVQDDQRLHFGLASAETVDEIRIVWPSGVEQVITDVSIDVQVTINETEGVVATRAPVEQDSVADNESTQDQSTQDESTQDQGAEDAGAGADDAGADDGSSDDQPGDDEATDETDDGGGLPLGLIGAGLLGLLIGAVGVAVWSRRAKDG